MFEFRDFSLLLEIAPDKLPPTPETRKKVVAKLIDTMSKPHPSMVKERRKQYHEKGRKIFHDIPSNHLTDDFTTVPNKDGNFSIHPDYIRIKNKTAGSEYSENYIYAHKSMFDNDRKPEDLTPMERRVHYYNGYDFDTTPNMYGLSTNEVHHAREMAKDSPINQPTHDEYGHQIKYAFDYGGGEILNNFHVISINNRPSNTIGKNANTIHRVSDKLAKKYSFPKPHKDNVSGSIKRYTESDSTHINKYLIGSSRENNYKSYDSHINHITTGITKTPLPHKLHVFSNTGEWNPVGSITEEGILHTPAFTSTSIHPEIALNWRYDSHILHFELPKGYKRGAFVRDVSSHPGEHEFLLDRDQKWKHVGTHQLNYKDSEYKVHSFVPAEPNAEPKFLEHTENKENDDDGFGYSKNNDLVDFSIRYIRLHSPEDFIPSTSAEHPQNPNHKEFTKSKELIKNNYSHLSPNELDKAQTHILNHYSHPYKVAALSAGIPHPEYNKEPFFKTTNFDRPKMLTHMNTNSYGAALASWLESGSGESWEEGKEAIKAHFAKPHQIYYNKEQEHTYIPHPKFNQAPFKNVKPKKVDLSSDELTKTMAFHKENPNHENYMEASKLINKNYQSLGAAKRIKLEVHALMHFSQNFTVPNKIPHPEYDIAPFVKMNGTEQPDSEHHINHSSWLAANKDLYANYISGHLSSDREKESDDNTLLNLVKQHFDKPEQMYYNKHMKENHIPHPVYDLAPFKKEEKKDEEV